MINKIRNKINKVKRRIKQRIIEFIWNFLFRDDLEESLKLPMSGYLVSLRLILNKLPSCINHECENCRGLIASNMTLRKSVDDLIAWCNEYYGINIYK